VETLSHGRHNPAPEAARGHQRDRLIAAVIESVHARGCERTSATQVASRAHVSKSDRLGELFPEIAEFALIPYLGPVEARRIISAA
jgi:hypothetical protein